MAKRSPSSSSSSSAPAAKKKPPPKKSGGGDMKDGGKDVSKNGKSTATREKKKESGRSKSAARKPRESRREEEKKNSRRSASRKGKDRDRRSRSRGGAKDAKASGRDRERSRSRKKERPRSRSRRDRRDDRGGKGKDERRREFPGAPKAPMSATDSRSLHATNPWAGYGSFGSFGWGAGVGSAGASWGRPGDGAGKGGGWGGGRTEYDEAAFSSFNRTAARGKGDMWMPGRGRNPDLEAERMGSGGNARWYSDHDDRREGPSSAPARRAPSPDKWKHDLFDAVKDQPLAKDLQKEQREKRFSEKSPEIGIDPDAVPAIPGMKVKNKKGRVAKVIEGYSEADFIILFEDEEKSCRRPIANFTTEDGQNIRAASDGDVKSAKSEAKDDKNDLGKPPDDEEEKEDKKLSDGDDQDGVVARKGMRVQNKHGRLAIIVAVDPFTVKFDDDPDDKERPIANFFTEDKTPLKLPDGSDSDD